MSNERASVVVLGATGAVGGALCRILAAEGNQVHAVGRNRDALNALTAVAGVSAWPVDFLDEIAARAVAKRIAAHEPTYAIAALGGWYVAEPGLELGQSKWQATIDSNLTTHFVAATTFAPILAGSAPSYVALNGIASHYPCEGSIAISVAGAGQSMMLDVLAAEGRDAATSFRELVIDTPVLMPGDVHDKDEETHSIAQVAAALESLLVEPATPGRVVRRHLGSTVLGERGLCRPYALD